MFQVNKCKLLSIKAGHLCNLNTNISKEEEDSDGDLDFDGEEDSDGEEDKSKQANLIQKREQYDRELESVFEDLESTKPTNKLIFLSPEKFTLCNRFVAIIKRLNSQEKLARIVLDEAHCVIEQAYFRTQYSLLGELIAEWCPDVPVSLFVGFCPHPLVNYLIIN